MALNSIYQSLIGQRLTSVLVYEPWRGLAPGDRGLVPPAIFGAFVLIFEHSALICTSPLRYLHGQHGTVLGSDTGEPVRLGYRLTLCDREAVDALLPVTFGFDDGKTRWRPWDAAPYSLHGVTVAGVTLTGATERAEFGSGIELAFGVRAPLRVTYRPDLDGGIELAEPGTHYRLGTIVVLSHDDDFGWLHPAAPLDFILDDQVWPSAKVADWPAPLRLALKRAKEPNAFSRHVLKRALVARFTQRPMHRQRLLALRYPVHCKDVPDGLIEDVILQLHDFKFP